MIICQQETLDQVLAEIVPLLVEHYEEIAWMKEKIPFDPDWDGYRKLEALGMLKIYTARDGARLVGYAIYLVSKSLHYKTTTMAKNDVFYIDPAARGTMASANLNKFAEARLKEAGAQMVVLHIKRSHDWTKLAARWGYEDAEANVMKWIGD